MSQTEVRLTPLLQKALRYTRVRNWVEGRWGAAVVAKRLAKAQGTGEGMGKSARIRSAVHNSSNIRQSIEELGKTRLRGE